MRLIIVGFGNVGQAFVRVIQSKEAWLKSRYGIIPKIVAIVDRGGAITDNDGVNLNEALAARKSHGTVAGHPRLGRQNMKVPEVINELEADVLLEFTPTRLPDGEPGLSNIESALKKGLNVVTTNKGPLAVAMPSLLELAEYQKVQFRFSGTVGGGTPMLAFAKDCLDADRIESIQGILNGTTNYILTRVFEAGVSMDAAVAEAQKAGYAETDPTLDVSGLDTASKLVIIANWILGRRITLKDVEVEGIRNVSLKDVNDAKRDDKALKLVGLLDASSVSVHPRAVPVDDPFCVNGTLNSIKFQTELAGNVTLIGPGAGGQETAMAVTRDLVEIKKALLK